MKDNRGGVEVLTQDLDVCFIGLMVIMNLPVAQYRRFDLTLA